ncbi:ECF transporter S component [Mycoplasmopsis edwardii]|nr:ECF transporter S component [Mycoplasmopsis edwardii]
MKKIAKKIIKINFQEINLLPKWTIKKMVFVAILIAISVSFAVVVVQIMPLAIIPSFKISFIGLPIKITGFIFGPAIGVFVGLISDLLSILFIPPAGYHPLYTVAAAINGLVSGIFGVYFTHVLKTAFSPEYKIQRIVQKISILGVKYNAAKMNQNYKLADKYALAIIKLDNKKAYIKENESIRTLKNINVIVSLVILTLVLGIISIIIYYSPQEILDRSFISDKRILLPLMSLGTISMMFFVSIGRFKFKSKTFLALAPIVSFSAVLELVNLPVLSYADLYSIGGGEKSDIFIWITQHVILSPVKIWFNVFVIYFSYSIVYKLINKNNALSYK